MLTTTLYKDILSLSSTITIPVSAQTLNSSSSLIFSHPSLIYYSCLPLLLNPHFTLSHTPTKLTKNYIAVQDDGTTRTIPVSKTTEKPCASCMAEQEARIYHKPGSPAMHSPNPSYSPVPPTFSEDTTGPMIPHLLVTMLNGKLTKIKVAVREVGWTTLFSDEKMSDRPSIQTPSPQQNLHTIPKTASSPDLGFIANMKESLSDALRLDFLCACSAQPKSLSPSQNSALSNTITGGLELTAACYQDLVDRVDNNYKGLETIAWNQNSIIENQKGAYDEHCRTWG